MDSLNQLASYTDRLKVEAIDHLLFRGYEMDEAESIWKAMLTNNNQRPIAAYDQIKEDY